MPGSAQLQASATPGMSVHLLVYVTSSLVLPASNHSTLCPQVHHWALPAERGGCFHIHARHDDTSICITASPPPTHIPTDPTPADVQQLGEHALSCQTPSASVLQAQHHPDHETCTSQHLQRLSDACVPSPPGTPSSACQGGGLGSTPGKGSRVACNARLAIGSLSLLPCYFNPSPQTMIPSHGGILLITSVTFRTRV